MKTITTLLILFIAIFGLQSCMKDPCKNYDQTPFHAYYNISDQDKSVIPFKGHDTLIYFSDAGDTAILYGKDKYQYYDIEQGNSGSADCPREISYNYEIIDYKFTGTNSDLYLLEYVISVYASSLFPDTQIHYFINNISGQSGPTRYNNPGLYTDSIQINGKYINGYPNDDINGLSFLYNFNYGFIRIKVDGGKTWTLKIK